MSRIDIDYLTKLIDKVDGDPVLTAELAYREGYKHALQNHATWHSGRQLVAGIHPLDKMLAEADTFPVPKVY